MLYLSALTLGEIRQRAENVPDPDPERRLHLLDWLEIAPPAFFSGRILPVDVPGADRWGRLQAQARHPLPAVDSLLAATALHHQLRLLTRNAKDFDHPGLEVINPWSDA
jgi:predicted nucleic acid-binding protein